MSDAPSHADSSSQRPIQIPVWRYVCPFCRRGRSTLKAASAHMARCFKNPAARSCKTCAAYQPPEPASYNDGYPGCNEGCDEGHSLAEGLPIGCSDWALHRRHNARDGASPKIQGDQHG